jgi:D-alanine-D-alanine ligase-like ATP-grasp enzyme
LLGLDILVDEGRRPWLIECNRSPSLTTDFIPDIKIGLVDDLLSLLEARLFGEGPQAATAQGFEPLGVDPAMVSRLVPDD